MRDGCVFCDYEGPSDIVSQGELGGAKDADGYWLVPTPWYVIHPIAPVTPGHLLVVAGRHVADFRDDPYMLGELMNVAATAAVVFAEAPGHNLIVSAGEVATQTVKHVHVHVVPRREGDGLLLPWSPSARPVIEGLLDIAETAMPDTYFARDSRVVAAKEWLG